MEEAGSGMCRHHRKCRLVDQIHRLRGSARATRYAQNFAPASGEAANGGVPAIGRNDRSRLIGTAQSAPRRSRRTPAGRPSPAFISQEERRANVTDGTLVLSLAGVVRCTGARPELPMLGEGVQPGVELHLAGRRVMPHDQAAVVVEQHLLGDPRRSDGTHLSARRTSSPAARAEGADVAGANSRAWRRTGKR